MCELTRILEIDSTTKLQFAAIFVSFEEFMTNNSAVTYIVLGFG